MFARKEYKMEKPKQSLDEWFAKADALLAEIDAQSEVPAVATQEKVGERVLAHEVAQPLAA